MLMVNTGSFGACIAQSRDVEVRTLPSQVYKVRVGASCNLSSGSTRDWASSVVGVVQLARIVLGNGC